MLFHKLLAGLRIRTGSDRGFDLAGIPIAPVTVFTVGYPVLLYLVASTLIVKQYDVLRVEHFTLIEKGENSENRIFAQKSMVMVDVHCTCTGTYMVSTGSYGDTFFGRWYCTVC